MVVGVVVSQDSPINRKNGATNSTGDDRIKVFPVFFRHGKYHCGRRRTRRRGKEKEGEGRRRKEEEGGGRRKEEEKGKWEEGKRDF